MDVWHHDRIIVAHASPLRRCDATSMPCVDAMRCRTDAMRLYDDADAMRRCDATIKDMLVSGQMYVSQIGSVCGTIPDEWKPCVITRWTQPMTDDPLLALPPAALDLLAGEARQRLVRFLLRWGYAAPLLGYLDRWLAAQPLSVTLRENRARVLLESGQAAEALAIIEAINAERGESQARRQFALRALIATGRFDEAEAQLDALAGEPSQAVYVWLQRGDVARARKQYDQADAAYRQAAALDPDAVSPARRLAALALDQGDAEAARGYIDALMLRPEFTPAVEDLELLRAAARRAGDVQAEAALTAQLAERERQEREPIAAELGLRLARHAEEPQDAPAEPPPAERPLPSEAYIALRESFGLSEFRPNQSRVIASVLAGRSTLAVMPTGAGKSLTYQLPAMLLPHATVVVSPLIALMKDQIDGMPAAVRERATMLNSTLSGQEVAERLREIAAGRYKLVYIAPERLRQRPFLQALKRCGISLFVVDEVHCISLWGQSFRPDYLFIGRALAELGNPPLLALTATASRETQAEIQATLGAADLVSASVFRPNLTFQVVRAGSAEEKQQAVASLCTRIAGPIIVYARARQTCEELAAMLRREGIAAEFYHAQAEDRSGAQERFMQGRTRVLVATVAFGMGIDKADIRAIIHYNLPQSVEAYYQEAGRAGRDGQPARCIMLYAPADKSRMTQWLNEQAITRDQLRELFRALKRMMHGSFTIINLDDLQRVVQTSDETFTRVGLSMLEQVGLVRRHFDLPRSANLTLRVLPLLPEYGELARVVGQAGLEPNVPVEVSLLELAATLGESPSVLEGRLLAWQDDGVLRYQGFGRDALLELLPSPPDVGERIDRLLADYGRRQDERVEAIAAYARSAQCRHRALAAHFGQRLAACRTACDICAPSQSGVVAVPQGARRPPPGPLPKRDERDGRSDEQRLLDGLAHLPFPMGRSGLAKMLKGASSSPITPDRCREHGALAHLRLSDIEELIERLVSDGVILRDERDEYRRLSLSRVER
jgi:ATP-dependent DNA helicase RecQ